MPKKLLATTIIITLAITMLSILPMSKGNFIPVHSEMDIYSPMPPFVSIYQNTSSILLNFAVRVPADAPNHYPEIKNIYYCVDGKSAIEITNVKKYEKVPWFSGICMKYNASLLIDNLEDGNHTVLVYCQDDMGNRFSATRDFAVANSPIPESSTLSYSSIIPLVIVSLAAIVAVVLASLVYFRRRRGKP